MKDSILEALREYCERVYEELKGEHPDFMVHYWSDVVSQARLAPEAEGSAEVLVREGRYRSARAALAKFYEESTIAISTASDETLLPTAQAVVTGAGQLVYILTEGSDMPRDILLQELTELGDTLADLVGEP